MSKDTKYNEELVDQVRSGELSVENTNRDQLIDLMEYIFPEQDPPLGDMKYYRAVDAKWWTTNNIPTLPTRPVEDFIIKQSSNEELKSAQDLETVAANYAERVCNGEFPINYTRDQVVNHTKGDFIAGANYGLLLNINRPIVTDQDIKELDSLEDKLTNIISDLNNDALSACFLLWMEKRNELNNNRLNQLEVLIRKAIEATALEQSQSSMDKELAGKLYGVCVWINAGDRLPDNPDYWLATNKEQEGKLVYCKIDGVIGHGHFWKRDGKMHFSYCYQKKSEEGYWIPDDNGFIDYENFYKIQWLDETQCQSQLSIDKDKALAGKSLDAAINYQCNEYK